MSQNRHRRRDRAIRQGLHAERVAKNPRYYVALNDHPNYREFGEPEYTDASGRQYKIAEVDFVRTYAPVPRSTNASVPMKLYVRLPPGTEWFPANKARIAVTLYPTNAAARVRHIIFRKHYILPQHRTGHIFVARSDWH
jgi:hypothetical protein